jgi:hypothetical protein
LTRISLAARPWKNCSAKRLSQLEISSSSFRPRSTAERPHFFLAYGTKSPDGLITFRDTEYAALREHEKSRANAKEKRREERSNMVDLFAGHQAEVQEATIDEIVNEQKGLASADLMAALRLEGAFISPT